MYLSQSSKGIQINPTVSSAIKWHPGHYMLSTIESTQVQKLGQLNGLDGEDSVLGAHYKFLWEQFETAEDAYDFSDLAELISTAEGIGKRINCQLLTRKFTGGLSGLVPDYIQDIDGPNTGVFETDGSWAVKIWDSRIMDRLIILWEKLAVQFDDESHFELMGTSETAQGSGAVPNGYTSVAFLAEYKKLVEAARIAWPHTQCRLSGNFWNPNPVGDRYTQINELMDLCVDNQFSVGGPDVKVGDHTHFQLALSGTQGTTDYRGILGSAQNVEGQDLANETLQALYDECKDKIGEHLFCDHIHWLRNFVIPTWDDDILPFLRTVGPTITDAPAGWNVDTS